MLKEMGESNLIRCQNGHMFSKKRYGTVCPYCNIETATPEKKEMQKSEVDLEEELFKEEVKPVCGWLVCIDGPRKGKDYKIITVPITSIEPRKAEINNINNIPEHEKKEIMDFMERYKLLEPHKWAKIKGFQSKEKAMKIIQKSIEE